MEKEQVREIRRAIFSRAKSAPNMEIMKWWVALDSCFENDELQEEEIGNMRWRLQVLGWQNQNNTEVARLITPLLEKRGLIDEKGNFIEPAPNTKDTRGE